MDPLDVVLPEVPRWGPLRLDDGSTVELRPIRPDDAERLGRFYERLSPRTAYLRFFSAPRAPSQATLRRLSTVDGADRIAVVASIGDEIVGVARSERRAASDEAEVAVVVEDAWQGLGLGRALLRRLGREASAHGVHAFAADVLGENNVVLRMAAAAGGRVVGLEAGVVEMRIPLGESWLPAAAAHGSERLEPAGRREGHPPAA